MASADVLGPGLGTAGSLAPAGVAETFLRGRPLGLGSTLGLAAWAANRAITSSSEALLPAGISNLLPLPAGAVLSSSAGAVLGGDRTLTPSLIGSNNSSKH